MRPDPRQLETSFKQTKAWLPSDPICQSQRHLSGPVSHDLSPPCVPLPSVPVTPLSRSSFGSSVSFPNPSPPTPEGPDPSLEGSVLTCSAERSLPTPVAAASTCHPRVSRCRAAAGGPPSRPPGISCRTPAPTFRKQLRRNRRYPWPHVVLTAGSSGGHSAGRQLACN